MAETLYNATPNITAPGFNAMAITPNDGSDMTYTCRALYIGGSGDISVVMDNGGRGGNTVTFVGLTAGTILPIQAARVRATGTTATNIVALW